MTDLELSKVAGKGVGKIIFNDALQLYGSDVNKIGGEWIVSNVYSSGLSDNLIVFRDKLSKNLSFSEAAFATPTGKWAKEAGFTNVKFVKEKNSNDIVVPTITDNGVFPIFEK